jgi:hypothetical protein
MKNNYKYPRILRKTRSAILTVLLFAATALQGVMGQVATTYTFSQTAGTYTPITGGTVYLSGTFDDGVSAAITIPSFTYNGTAYTSVKINANGHIAFGTYSSIDNYSPLSSTTDASGGLVSGFGRDLNNAAAGTPEIRYELVGNEFVVQYQDVRRFNVASERISFQIRLNTVTNVIRVVYGGTITPGSNTTYPQIGLKGPNNTFATNINNRTIASAAGSWINSNPGAANSSTMYFNSAQVGTVPAVGLTFTWTPATCFTPSGLLSSAITATTATISWTAASPAPGNGYHYYVSTSATAPTSGTTPTGSTAAGVVTANLTGLTAQTQYYYWVRSNCNGTDFSNWAGSGTFTTPCVAATIPFFEGFESGYVHNTAVAGCWSQQSVTGAAVWIANDILTDYNRAPRSGSWSAFLQWSNDDWLFYPLQLTGGVNYTFEVYARQDGATAGNSNITLAYGTTATAAGMTNTVLAANGIVNGNYQLKSGTFTPSSSGVYFIGIKGWMNGTPYYISIDDISVYETPTCSAMPTALGSSAVTSTTATISWTAAAPAPANGYHYYVSTSATAPTGVTTPTGSTAAGVVTANLTGLTANTTYYYWVRSNCNGTDFSNWAGSGTFNTPCAAATIPFFEGFESGYVHNTAVAGCWGQQSVTGAAVWMANDILTDYNRAPRSGSWSAFLQWSNDDWLFYPLQLTGGVNYTFEVYARQDGATAGNSNITLSYGTTATAAGMTNTVLAANGIVNGNYQLKSGTFTPSSSGVYFIGIKGWMNGTPYYISIDDISVYETPTCAAMPSALNSSAVTAATATISWTAASPAPGNGYHYYVSTSATAPTSGTTPTGSTAAGVTTANLTSLTAQTHYYYWVRSNCNGTDFSNWAGSGTFYTGHCLPVGNTNYFLTNVVTTGGNTNISNATGASPGGYIDYSGSISCSNYEGNGTGITLTPSSGTNYFYCWIDWNNDLDFNDAGETIFATTGFTSSWTSTINIPPGTSLGNKRMRVANSWSGTITSCGPSNNGEYEDYTFTVIVAPACAQQPSGLNHSALTNTTATISWTAASPAPGNGYHYYVSTSATAPTGATTPTGSTAAGVTTANLTGLTTNTAYYYWVRSNCNGTDFSNWAGSGTFYTGYCLPIGNTNYFLTNVVTTGGNTNISNATGASPGGYIDYSGSISCSNYEGNGTGITLTPSSGTNYFYCWIDWNNDLDFNDAGETIFATTGFTSSWTSTINIPPGTSLGNKRMRVANSWSGVVTSCGPSNNGEYEDYTFTVIAAPACAQQPSVLVSSSVLASSATISWTAASPAPGNGYQYYVSISATAPTGATTPTGSVGAGVTTVDLSGLSHSAVYYFWVRSNCDGTDLSNWAGSGTFTTPCLPASIPFFEGFEAGFTHNTPVAGCWSQQSNSGAAVWTANASFTDYNRSPRTGSRNAFLAYNNSDWLFYPLQLTGGANYNFDVYARQNTAVPANANITLAYGTSPTAAGMTNIVLASSTLVNGDYQLKAGMFTPPTTGVYYIGIRGVMNNDLASWYISIDDIAVYPSPSCLPPVMTATTAITPTSATINWTASPSAPISGYIWEVRTSGAAGSGPAGLMSSGYLPAGTVSHNVTGLIANTSYQVYVRANCGGGDLSAWADGTFTNANGDCLSGGCSGGGLYPTATQSTTSNSFVTVATDIWQGEYGVYNVIAGATYEWSLCATDGANAPYDSELTLLTGNGASIICYSDDYCGDDAKISWVATFNGTVRVLVSEWWIGPCDGSWSDNTTLRWRMANAPYWTGSISSDWNVGGNWNSGTVPLATHDVEIPTSPIGGNFPNIEVGATINSIQIQSGATVGIQAGQSLTATGVLTNNGTVNVASGGSLVQTATSTLAGSGTYNVTRIGSANYDYWSSPVVNTPSSFLGGVVYEFNPAVGTGDPADDVADPGWVSAGATMLAGQGYAVFGAGTKTFSGTVHNGQIDATVAFYAQENAPYSGSFIPGVPYNLIGNPYPSSINVSQFLTLNSGKLPTGTVYLWDDPGGSVYATGDYAQMNSVTYIAGGGGTPNPGLRIGSHQGFKIEVNATASGGAAFLRFTNDMRSAQNTSVFFKQVDCKLLWLSSLNSSNSFNQLAIGFLEDGTDGEDWGYDSPKFNAAGPLSFFSYMDGTPYGIQIYGDLNTDRIVPLGLHSGTNTLVTIALDSTENLTEDIILEDRHLALYHDLRTSPYVFQSAATLYDDRFFLHFAPQMVTGVIDRDTAPVMNAFIANGVLNVSATGTMNGPLELLDMSGRVVWSSKNVMLNGVAFRADVSDLSSGIYVVRLIGVQNSHTQKVLK